MVSSIIRLSLFSLILASTASAIAEIDLTPTLATRELDGIKLTQLHFRDDSRIVSYEPPTGWTYAGTSKTLRLRSAAQTDGEAFIEVCSSTLGRDSKGKEMDHLKEIAPALVPADAANINIISTERDPLQIDGHSTFVVTIEYSLFGQKFTTSVLFLPLEDCDVRFRVQSHSANFKQLSQEFQRSLYSWQWLLAKS
jgi:hypothetical protein